MIINFTKQEDKYISEYISSASGDTIVDAKEKMLKKDKTPLFSERPYVLVCDYTMISNLRNLISMGRGKFNGSKIFYCVFVMSKKGGRPLPMAKNISAVKNMVLFGCEVFKTAKNGKVADDAIFKAKMIGSSVRDSVPLFNDEAVFPMRVKCAETF